jgi:ABC-type uncharacterized transport system permease subunit
MPAWKILVIGALSCVCLGLALATIAIPISMDGAQRWTTLASLLLATIIFGGLLAIFPRYAGASLDVRPRGANR